jgi:short-subunit dehydrogenase
MNQAIQQLEYGLLMLLSRLAQLGYDEMDDSARGISEFDLVSVAENVWVLNDKPIETAGLRLPIRMTIIRLANGDLLLHSPTRYSAELCQRVERLGTIRYFFAPSIAHWMFISKWQVALPGTAVVTAPGLGARKQVRESGLRIDQELVDGTPEEWAEEIETVLVCAPLFAEVALFHKPSRTLVLADLVQNLRPEEMSAGMRIVARVLGIAAPHGRAPAYLRLLLRFGGRATKHAVARLIAFAPNRVIFAHGDWFKSNARERLRHSLRWLTDDTNARTGLPKRTEMVGIRVVITGASSGIGRAAALAFARAGASVALAARREAVLQDVAQECEALGGRAVVVPTDVMDPKAVERLAATAEDKFGGIDVWINNAGTGVFGPYQSSDLALHRRTVEVNLLGPMHGAFAAVPVFLRQGHGILINNISIGGWTPTPFAAAYTASKFGLRGFTASLRQELGGQPHIHVCGVFPAIVDTPGFVHGANMSGRRLDPGPFLYQAEDVAETFLRLVRHPRDEVAVGWPARAGQVAYIGARGLTETLTGTVFRFLLSRAHRADNTEGAMIEPSSAGVATSGGWLARKDLPPAGQISRMVVLAGVGLVVVGTIAALRSKRDKPSKHATRNFSKSRISDRSGGHVPGHNQPKTI